MQVSVDLGFRSLVLAILTVVLSVVVRVKWQRYVARKVEIKRLLVMASEDTARVEQETNLSYYSSLDTLVSTGRLAQSTPLCSPSSSRASRTGYQCAVCFRRTTTRCSQCKSVRYCSGKCQIIHWRHGHKEDCRPFNLSNHGDRNGRVHQELGNLKHEKSSPVRHDSVSVDANGIRLKSGHSISSRDISQSSCEEGIDDAVSGEELGCPPSVSSVGSVSEFLTSPHPIGSPDVTSPVKNAKITRTKLSDARLASSDSTEEVNHGYIKEESHQVDFFDNVSTTQSISDHRKYVSASDRSASNASTSSSSTSKKVDAGVDISGVARSNKLDEKIFYSSIRDEVDDIGGKGTHAEINDSGIIDRGAEIDEIQGPRKQSIGSSDVCKKSRTVCDSHDMIPNRDHLDLKINGDQNVKSVMSLKARIPSDRAAPYSVVKSKVVLATPIFGVKDNATMYRDQNLATSTSPASLGRTEKPQKSNSLKNMKVPLSDVQSGAANSVPVATQSCASGPRTSLVNTESQMKGLSKSGKCNYMGQISYDLFVNLYVTNVLELKPFGLVNCGNSCYANAVLQCLAFTPPLSAYFARGLHSKTCLSNEWCFACEFEKLILRAKEGLSPLSPFSIISHLQRIGTNLSRGCEEDAHEFLRCAIDTMQSICQKEGDTKLTSSVGGNATLIELTFGGYLHSKIRCLNCHSKSDRQERMMDLAVEIEGDVEKLEDSITRFTRSEILDGENKYYCSRCKSKERAKKKLTILEAPNVLTIALKRFQAGKYGKLNKSVSFPEVLDLAPYMSGTSDKSPVFRLFAVIVHLDVMKSAFSGHYICYVKTSENKWFKVDDTSVIGVDLERVLRSEAYMLLYSRFSPRAPKLVRSVADKVASSKSPKETSPRAASSRDNLSCYESFYLKFHRLQKIIEEDSSSDSLSFSSSNSDEGSSSTDTTKDSISTDDGGLSKVSSSSTFDSETSSSTSSPLHARNPSTNRSESRGSSFLHCDSLSLSSSRKALRPTSSTHVSL